MAGYSWIVRSTCRVRTDNDGIPKPISAQSHKAINSQTVVRLRVILQKPWVFLFCCWYFWSRMELCTRRPTHLLRTKIPEFRLDCITSRPELWTSLLLSIPEFPDTKNSTIYNGLINEAFRGPAQPVSSIYFSFECLFFSCIPN